MISQKEMILDFIKSKDVLPKVACLLLAVVLWTHINNQNRGEMLVKVKAEFKNLPENLIVSDIRDRYVSVKFRGSAGDLELIDKRNVKAYINLANPVYGQPVRYDISASYPDLPEGVRISVVEKRVFVTVNKRESRYIFIRPKISGKPSDGYFIGNLTADPTRVLVSGTTDDLDKLDIIELEPIAIDGVVSSFRRTGSIQLDKYQSFEFQRSQFDVQGDVYRKENVLKFSPDLDLYGLAENLSYDVAYNKVVVHLQTAPGSKPDINTNDIKAWIDLSHIDESDFVTRQGTLLDSVVVRIKVRTMLNKPQNGVAVLTVVPNYVLVSVRK